MRKLLKFLALISIFSIFTSVSVFAASENIITDNGSDEWITVVNNDGVLAIRFIDTPSDKLRLSPQTLFDGNKSLTTSNYTYLCQSPDRNVLFDTNNIIEVWNGGDNEGNGAVTFKVGSTEVAVNANSGAQVMIRANTAYSIYAKANWYDATYSLNIKDYC